MFQVGTGGTQPAAGLKDIAARFWSKVDRTTTPDGCWPWTGSLHKHRGRIEEGLISVNGRRVNARRLALKLTGRAIPEGMKVWPVTCGNPLCCRPDHLRIGTMQDVLADLNQKGRGPGARSRRLTEAQAREIRTLYAAGGITLVALGQRFGVTSQAVSLLISGRTWKHTDPKPVWPSPHQDKWNKRYGQLAEFRERFGHCQVPYIWSEDPALERWCDRQRTDRKSGYLRVERIEKLDALGFIWDQRVVSWPGKSWEKNFLKLEQFKLNHGHCNVPSQPNHTMSEWSRRQRNLRTKGLLGAEKIQRLDGIGFRWGRLRSKWKTRMQELEQFKLNQPRAGHHRPDDAGHSNGSRPPA